MTKEERREYMRIWRAEHKEERREYLYKWKTENKEERRESVRKYKDHDLNRSGIKKCSIRSQSNQWLSHRHAKLDEYEIHHCFGYEDYKKFIYIPKTLHNEIHKQLRENNISADTDHWLAIRDLVNSCDQYTYISV